MSGKTKIALCLSGETRSSMFCFPYIYESFINLGDRYEIDVYIHSWKNFRALNLYSPKKYKIDPLSSIEVKNHLLNTFKLYPKIYDHVNFQTHNLMYYGIKECFNLIEKEYEIYIRCRFDLIFESKLILDPIIYDIKNKKYDLFSLHSDYPTKPKGIDDQVLICNPNSMSILSKYYENIYINPSQFIQDYFNFYNGFTAEGFLSNYLKKHNIKVNHNPLSNYRLVRHSNVITDNPYNFLDQ